MSVAWPGPGPRPDPKARVVEIITDWEWDYTEQPEGYDANQDLADRLDSAGLLASAPVVPSIQELESVVRKYRGDFWIAQAIRNHLLTLGWRAK